MQHQTPQSRLAALNQVVTQIITPMMPILQQQGIQFDINAYLQKVAAYSNMPDLGDIVTIGEPPQPGGPSGGGGGESDTPKMPANTQREYVRHNVSGQTREASDRNLVSSMLGINTGGNPNTTSSRPQGK